MNHSEKITYKDLFEIIEKLYYENNYNQIVSIKDTRPDIDFLDPTRVYYNEFTEIFAISYIEVQLFKKALIIVNNHLKYLLVLGIASKEYFDDLTTFCLMKIEIHKNQNSILKQLRCVLNYIRFGGKDKKILEMKVELEEALYMKYININKVILYSMLGIIILSILSSLSIGKSFLTTLTSIGIIWYLLNYVFWKKIKKLYLKVIRRYLLWTSRHLYAG